MSKQSATKITVAELIERLETLPKDAIVLLGGDVQHNGHIGVVINDEYIEIANRHMGMVSRKDPRL